MSVAGADMAGGAEEAGRGHEPSLSPLVGENGEASGSRERDASGAERGVSAMPHEDVRRRQRGTVKRLRRTLSDAERVLWEVLHGDRFEGVGFRRQMPIGPYIVGFVAHRMRLVIEVDGGQPLTPEGHAADAIRDVWLAGRGYRVLRVSDHDVLANIDAVADAIAAALPAAEPPQEPATLGGPSS